MEKLSFKKIILAIITLVIGLGLHLSSSRILSPLMRNVIPGSIFDNFINELFFAAIVVAIIFIIKKQSLLRFDKGGFVTGLKCSAPVIAYSIVLILISLIELKDHTLVRGSEIVLFIIFCLLIGVAEEGLFRGAVQELVLDAIEAKTRKQLAIGIIIASAFFGSSHFVNLFKGADLSAVIIQVLTATASGMVFGAVCVRSGRSIWAAVLAHALSDCGAFINSGMLWGQKAIDAINGMSVGAFITAFVDILIFIYLMRSAENVDNHVAKKKIENDYKEEKRIGKSHKKGLIIVITATAIILLAFLVIIPMVMTTF